MPVSGRDEPLTPEVIVEAGLAVTRRVGLDRLTMRAVAEELGVSPMAIYHHVHDKKQLVESIVREVTRGDAAPVPFEGESWEDALRRTLLARWERYMQYRGVGEFLMRRPLIGNTPKSIAQGVAFFTDAGFSERNAQLAWSCAITFLHGRLSVDTRLRGPSGNAARFKGIRARDHLEYGLDVVIAGIHALQAAQPVATSDAGMAG
jgi:AcrR family transcriptional regulator